MSKMGICAFSDGCHTTDFVAPKSDYPDAESFVKACEIEFDYFDGESIYDLLKVENVKEGYCRYYPISPYGIDIDGGCYSFSNGSRGSFPVWYIPINR